LIRGHGRARSDQPVDSPDACRGRPAHDRPLRRLGTRQRRAARGRLHAAHDRQPVPPGDRPRDGRRPLVRFLERRGAPHGRAVGISFALIAIALSVAAGAELAGVPGALLGIPFGGALKVVSQEVLAWRRGEDAPA
jgi:hypothetical protein